MFSALGRRRIGAHASATVLRRFARNAKHRIMTANLHCANQERFDSSFKSKPASLRVTIQSKYDEKKYHYQGRQSGSYRCPYYTAYTAAGILSITPALLSGQVDEVEKKHVQHIVQAPELSIIKKYPQVKDTPESEMTVEDHSTWYSMYVENRILWLGATVGSLFAMPAGVLNAGSYLLTNICARLYQEGIENAVEIIISSAGNSMAMMMGSVITGAGLSLVSAASVFFPGIGHEVIKASVMPAVDEQKKAVVNASDVLHPNSSQYLIYFCQSGSSHLHNHKVKSNGNLSSGETDLSDSKNDLIKRGIARISHLAKINQWSNDEIAGNICLFGHGLGGSVALHVAEYFKTRNNIDIPIFVYNSFGSLNAVLAGRAAKMGVPVTFGNALASMFFDANKDWKLDSVNAAKKLNREMLHYTNLGHVVHTLEHPLHADPVITDGATFTESMEVKSSESGNVVADGILHMLKAKGSPHLMYPSDVGDHHAAPLSTLVSATQSRASFELFKEKVRQKMKVQTKSVPVVGCKL